MPIVGGGRISPEGDRVIYRLGRIDDFEDNQVEFYSYLYDSRTDQTRQFTEAGIVSEVRWLSNETVALMKRADNSGFQIYVFEGLVGEGSQITDHPGGIATFEPFGNGFIYIAQRMTKKQVSRESKYGNFVDVEEEESRSALYYVDRERILEHRQGSQHSSSEGFGPAKPVVELSELLEIPFKIESVVPSPNDDAVFINCRRRDDFFFENDTYCFRIELDPDSIFDDEKATASIRRLTRIALPKGARVKAVSPDGAKLLVSHKESDLKGRVQADLWLLDLALAGGLSEELEVRKHLRCITGNFDQEPLSVYWTKLGIFLSYWNESICGIARLSETGEVEVWDIQGLSAEYFHVNDDGAIFLRGLSPTTLAETYVGSPKSTGWALRRITEFNERYADWDFGTAESIRWTSRDGTEIEGILRKPSNFDPNKKYPLLFKVHGGPAAASPFILLDNNNRYFYPTVQLLNKDILILEPNYRGSLGRGQSFLALNFDNLGIGDMWDLESAIDHLASQGFVDETRVGSMGWSQGGYISSFVAMHSSRFKAVSAGAALCSWRTYYSGSDQRLSILLSGDPYTNKEMFDKTAPISAIDKAKTPILFQHGENDPRVPLISAMEMYRALKAKGVKTRLIVFPGHGHGVFKPRECYALMVQNYRWFVHHLLGEELDLLMDDTGETIEG
ncbi:MAG: prolyl oligopeptidase family serine peptidase [Candidatus Bathyarchaeota archaeon]|nr:prolyl oligopeptidase family serine peptidase [Candidatus Bathyarchaeota archaeon]